MLGPSLSPVNPTGVLNEKGLPYFCALGPPFWISTQDAADGDLPDPSVTSFAKMPVVASLV